jgi:uncharacterized protein (DUF4415 family)
MPALKQGSILSTPQEDAAIEAAIAADPDTRELGKDWFAQAHPVGQPTVLNPKSQVNLTLDSEVPHASG